MTPDALRAWVAVLIGDIAIPGTGIYLALTLDLRPFHLPLLAGMLGVPLVRRGAGGGGA